MYKFLKFIFNLFSVSLKNQFKLFRKFGGKVVFIGHDFKLSKENLEALKKKHGEIFFLYLKDSSLLNIIKNITEVPGITMCKVYVIPGPETIDSPALLSALRSLRSMLPFVKILNSAPYHLISETRRDSIESVAKFNSTLKEVFKKDEIIDLYTNLLNVNIMQEVGLECLPSASVMESKILPLLLT